MDTFQSLLAENKRLRDENLRLLEGYIDGTLRPHPEAGVTKEEVIAILKQDVETCRATIKRLEGKDA